MIDPEMRNERTSRWQKDGVTGEHVGDKRSVEIDNEKFILFKLTKSEKPVIIPIEKPVITKDSTVYTVVTEAGATLKISISSTFCNDGISDHLYEYKMTVWYKGQIYKGCAVVLNPAANNK